MSGGVKYKYTRPLVYESDWLPLQAPSTQANTLQLRVSLATVIMERAL